MIGTDVAYAAQLLREGQLVAIPTETVYGLAGNALDVQAVARIFEVKNRPSFDPLIIHVAQWAAASPYLVPLPPQVQALAERLAAQFMPGPLTLLLPRSPLVPDLVTSGLDRVAVRVPAHPLAQSLLALLNFPLAAPSANPFGYISPTTAQHVAAQLGDQIPYILDGGPAQVGLESTIVGFEEGRPVVYRKGGVAIEDIEAAIGPVQVLEHSSSRPHSPGMLQSHYAPRVPLRLGALPALIAQYGHLRLGVISFCSAYPQIEAERQKILSPSGSLAEAAAQLFAAMRELDGLGLDLIVAEPMPEEGLGRAINDRLRRAAA